MTIEAEEKPTFTQEDLAEIEAGDDGGEAEGKGADAQTGAAGGKDQDGKAATDDGGDKGEDGKTLATGADTEAAAKAKEAASAAAKPKSDWPDNWRERLAEHYAAGDKKRYNQELKRLQRITDPVGVYGMYREMESKFTSGGLIKLPGKDAKPEEVEAFHKALGVPEKPEGYIEHIKLDNGAVIGDADKPFLNTFSEAMHKAGAPPSAVNAAANWYYRLQEEHAAELDEADEDFKSESEKALKEELGASFRRSTNAISGLFATAPGGADARNPESLYARLVGGRTADGKIIGNDPDVMRWLIGMAREVNPIVTVTEDGATSVKSIEQELADLAKLRTTDRRRYWSKEVQEREAELYAAQEKYQARQRA